MTGLPGTTSLAELDASIWRRVPEQAIRRLADEVAYALTQPLPSLALEVPVFATRPAIESLRLSPRTMNGLRYAGLIREGHAEATTVGALLSVPNLGAKSVLDALMEDEGRGGRPAAAIGATQSRAVRRAASELERKRWAKSVHRDDPRIGPELTALDPFAETAADAGESLGGGYYTPADAKRAAASIRAFIASVDARKTRTLEREMEEVVDALTGRATAKDAVLARTGLAGAEPMTLEEAGRRVGVTRERVRQIEKKFRERVAAAECIWTPVLDRALRTVADSIPMRATDVGGTLSAAALAEPSYSLRSLIAAADLFGKDVAFLARDEGDVVPVGDWAPTESVRSAARRLVEHWGATTTAEVAARLSADGFDVRPDLLRAALEQIRGFAWLDDERGWFWIRGTRNRLLNQALKIMAVAGSIELTQLRAGVGRHHRMKGFRPPREVLGELCVQAGYRRDGHLVIGGPDLPDWRDVLGQNERLLTEALFDEGPVMRRDDLERAAVRERGLNRSSFYVYLTYSPILERFAPGVYGLRGASVTAAQVDALIPRRVRHQVLQDHGWTSDGRVWAAFRISPASESTGILGTPAAIRSVLTGSFDLVAENDEQVGTLVVEQNMWGLSPFIRRWGVEAGDYVVIIWDVAQRRATVAAGEHELLLRFQSGE